MEKEFKSLSGLSLIIGSVLMTVTMVLHPAGGNINHINNMKMMIMVSHGIAVFSLPFMAFGFWGLSLALLTPGRISMLAFSACCFGLVATMLAASINGLTLPQFASLVVAEDIEHTIARPIIRYGTGLNIAMDYILMLSLGLAIGIWSVLIIRNTSFPSWLGYYGLALLALGLVAGINRYNFTGLIGFRAFVFGLVSWIILSGLKVLLAKRS